MNTDTLPLISRRSPSAAVVYRAGKAISQAQLLVTITALAHQLPTKKFVINLCEDRYHFLLVFAAALLKQSSNILPPNRQANTISAIAEDYPDHVVLVDTDQYIHLPNCLDIRSLGLDEIDANTDKNADTSKATITPPQINAEHVAAIAFTSGSTGKPRPNIKLWRTLAGTAKLLGQRFVRENTQPHIVATVPSQHMYGLEMTVMMALQTECIMVSGHPFFPQDIVNALAHTPEPRVFVTTPIHLRALLGSGLTVPALDRIISATAPLSTSIAAAAEKQFSIPVEEIYGCTEAGSLATRQTLNCQDWQLLDEIQLEKSDKGFIVRAPHLAQVTALQDRLEIKSASTFSLLGRSADMLNVGGKRASLADLNQKLLDIDGVDDGIVFLAKPNSTDKQRPAALVVSSTLSEFDILAILAKQVDPVFLPRPLRKLNSLPRNSAGKLPIDALISALALEQNDSATDL